MLQRLLSYLKKLPISPMRFKRWFRAYWRRSFGHKVLVVIIALLGLSLGTMYGIARWYIATSNDKPLVLGATFIPAYAESLGVDPKETMQALLDDVGVRHFRLVSYWDQLEPEQGEYDFSLLDWQFEKAEKAGAKISLSVGLRQPRWPECHIPTWAATTPTTEWQPALEDYMTEVVNRYKDSPALESYQVENEFFLRGFGLCTNHDRDRLVSEYNLVKRLDPRHPVIVSRSNNAIGMPVGEPKPDLFGISIYKRVWDAQLTHRYVEYPFPAWYYAFVAGSQKLFTGRDMIIHELQAESWPPNQKFVTEVPLSEQNKSFNAERFEQRIEFGKGTGMRQIDLWGAEYWYYRLVHEQDDSLWNVAKEAFHEANRQQQ